MKTAVNVINLSPTSPLDGDIPEEIWSGKKASYNHMKVFGCQTFIHIPQDERRKVDSKIKEGIYFGSSKDEFGYRLWDPMNKKIVRSRDAMFFKDETIEEVRQSERPKPKTNTNSSHKSSPTVRDDLRGQDVDSI